MNAHIQHLHYSAQLAELNGFKHFAAAIRHEMAKALLEAPSTDFWRFVLGLPHAIEGVEWAYVEGKPFTQTEFMQKFARNVCACCEETKYGPVVMAVVNARNLVQGEGRTSIVAYRYPSDPVQKMTDAYTMFGKHSSNPKGEERTDVPLFPEHLNNYIPPIEPGKGTILLHPKNEHMREFYLAQGFKVMDTHTSTWIDKPAE